MKVNGKLEAVSWSTALKAVAAKFTSIQSSGGKFGVIGSNQTTNEENYYLQKFARQVLGTNNLDHLRTGDVTTLVDALSGKTGKLATTADFYESPAVLVIGADLSVEHPFLSFQIRANYRHHSAHVYAVTPEAVREDQYTVQSVRTAAGTELAALEGLRSALAAESALVIAFNDAVKGAAVHSLVEFGESLGIPVKYAALVDYSNSRGAVDFGVTPELLPGFEASALPGLTAAEMIATPDLAALWVVGENPLRNARLGSSKAFVVVQDMFLTETAKSADVVLPSASLYEKNGTVTNGCGEVQRVKRAVSTLGTKPDLEIIGLIAKEMGVAAKMGPWSPDAVYNEIRSSVKGYDIPLPMVLMGAQQTTPVNGRVGVEPRPELVRSAKENLFTSGTLGRYSKILNSVIERRAVQNS